MSCLLPRAFGVLALALLFTAEAEARVFKCVDSNGSISYTQQPCDDSQTTAKVINTGRTKPLNLDCRLARNFATETARQMREGQSSMDVFAQYGGLDSMTPSAVSIVNYVYSQKESLTATVGRIAGMSSARCQNGSFGHVDCSVFPPEFVSQYGGCEAAANAAVDPGRAQDAEGDSVDHSSAMLQQGDASDVIDPSASAVRTPDRQCQERILEEINTIQARLMGGLTETQAEILDRELRSKQDALNGC